MLISHTKSKPNPCLVQDICNMPKTIYFLAEVSGPLRGKYLSKLRECQREGRSKFELNREDNGNQFQPLSWLQRPTYIESQIPCIDGSQ